MSKRGAVRMSASVSTRHSLSEGTFEEHFIEQKNYNGKPVSFGIGSGHFFRTFVICVTLNLFGYMIASKSQTALFLDTGGTVTFALAFGPFYGALCGVFSALIGGLVGVLADKSSSSVFIIFQHYNDFSFAHTLVAGVVGGLPRLLGPSLITKNKNRLYYSSALDIFDPLKTHGEKFFALLILGILCGVLSSLSSVCVFKLKFSHDPEFKKQVEEYYYEACGGKDLSNYATTSTVLAPLDQGKKPDNVGRRTRGLRFKELGEGYPGIHISTYLSIYFLSSQNNVFANFCEKPNSEKVSSLFYTAIRMLYGLPDKVLVVFFAFFYISSRLPQYRYCFSRSKKNYCLKDGVVNVWYLSPLIILHAAFLLSANHSSSAQFYMALESVSLISPVLIIIVYFLIGLIFKRVQVFEERNKSAPVADHNILFKKSSKHDKDVFEDALKLIVATISATLIFAFALVAQYPLSPPLKVIILQYTFLIINAIRYTLVFASRDRY